MAYTYAQKLMVARGRHKDCMTQEQSAALIGAVRETVSNWERDQDEEWVKATEEVFAEIRREGRSIAWRGLLGAAGAGDVTACKAVLARAEGPEPQSLGLHGVADKPPVGIVLGVADVLQSEEATELACQLSEQLTSARDTDAG